ncbi:hypothetical protein Clacol_003652 [Clathrus columnatus]|uniref:PXA domain-containing protein n=1 Tax=Clathrus columnatus TaxID=1419009 RepID=A0AAV5ABX4_9AGAM|nr:hypothetical protein Clacol_003652 [Clathrus columnatus]
MSSLSTYRHVTTASHRSVIVPSSIHTAVTINSSKIPISLAKRLLFPQFPAGAELPSLLVNEDSQLNAQLYDFLALALRGFIMPWWGKLSKYDKEFLPEITRIIAVFLRSIEARLALVDLPTLLLKEIPALITQHYSDYRNVHYKLGSSYATGGTSTLPQLFHQLQPHMAVSADGQWNETYMRQIVEHVMKMTLPPQDWEAEAERTIVREIIVKNILGSVFNKLAQPWFVYKLLIELAIPFFLLNYILTSSRLTKIIIQSKAVLFPNGYPGPPPVEPSPEEQVLIKEQLELKLFNFFPAPLSALVLGPDEETRQQTIHDIIEPLSSRECNVHLLIFLLDAIIVGVFPELGVVPVTTTTTSSNYTEMNDEDPL